MHLLSVKGLTMNSVFTFIGSWSLPRASELAGMKNSLKNPAHGLYSSTFLEVLTGKTKYPVLALSVTGNTGHSKVSEVRKAEQGMFSEH